MATPVAGMFVTFGSPNRSAVAKRVWGGRQRGGDSYVEMGKCWCKLRICLSFMRRNRSLGCVYDGSGAA